MQTPVMMIALFSLLLLAAWTDQRTHKIPNLLVMSGLAIAFMFRGYLEGVAGLGQGLLGIFVGIGVMIPLYLLRQLGAGDVKLIGMVGAFIGPASVLYAIVMILIAGGVLAIGFSLFRRRGARVVSNLSQMMRGKSLPQLDAQSEAKATALRFPYAWAVLIGVLNAKLFRLN